MTKRFLIITNFVLLAILLTLGVRHVIFKIRHAVPTVSLHKITSQEFLCKCEYSLEYFDFHYKKETGNPKIIMLGNSLIRHGNWEALLGRNDVINRGISGDKLCCILQRTKYLKNLGAKACFIEGGINDLPLKSTTELNIYFAKLVNFAFQQDMKPIITLLFYISPKAGKKYPYRNNYQAINDSIYKLNNNLKLLANERQIDYIDLNSEISDTVNRILLDKYTTDGVHLKPEAYKIWAQKVNEILKKGKI